MNQRTDFRLLLGGSIWGTLIGTFLGALLGTSVGLVQGEFSHGLDGALLGAVLLGGAGAAYGWILARREARSSRPHPSILALAATTTTHHKDSEC